MSAPPALTVQVLVFGLKDWLPAGAGLPMSAQLHGDGHGTGGRGPGGEPVTATESIVAAFSCVESRDETARPASGFEPRFKLAVDAAIGVHKYPSEEPYAVT